MYCRNEDSPTEEISEGVLMKPLAYGEKTLLTEITFEKGGKLPSHSHPHEQTGYLVSGRVELTIGEETYEVLPGDSWSILGGVTHKAEVKEDSKAIEVFSPVREEYLL